MNTGLTVEPLGSKDTGRCPCCGHVSRVIWGVVRRSSDLYGSYFVHWTIGHVFEHGADFYIILRGWGNAADERYAVRLKYRVMDNGPEFMVVDAQPDAIARIGALADHFLKRNDVIGGPVSKPIFDICDVILAEDHRVAELWKFPRGD